MGGIEKAITRLVALENGETSGFVPDARCMLIVTLVYLVALLSLPTGNLSHIIWFAFYPIIGCGILGVSYAALLRRSLCVLPFIALIGIANPFFNRESAFEVAGVVITRGWLEFISILLRGLFSVQALLLMCSANGFAGICRAMSRLGLPSVLTTQLLLVYRYLGVLLSETLDMKRARESRGYGRKSLPFSQWGAFVGQLFVRTVGRAERIHNAMLARGFEGAFRYSSGSFSRWKATDTVYLVIWIALFAALYCFNPSEFMFAL